jgi:hypothetical protein
MAYSVGSFAAYTPPLATVSGVATVQYRLRDAAGVPTGEVLTGIQVSAREIQPSNSSLPRITMGTSAGQALVVAIPILADQWVDESGDTMTGDLNLSGNELISARISEGSF